MNGHGHRCGVEDTSCFRSIMERSRLAAVSLLLIMAWGVIGLPCLAAEPTLAEQAESYFKQGELLLNIKQYGEALPLYTKAISLYTSIGKQEPPYSEAYRKRAITYYGLKQYKNALSDFDQAIKINPSNSRAYLGRGLVRSFLKDTAGAVTDYNQALAIDPNYTNAYINRGSAKIMMNDLTGAAADYVKAAELDYKNVDALLGLGLAYTQLKQYDDAGRHFLRVLELDPANDAAQKGLDQIKPLVSPEIKAAIDAPPAPQPQAGAVPPPTLSAAQQPQAAGQAPPPAPAPAAPAAAGSAPASPTPQPQVTGPTPPSIPSVAPQGTTAPSSPAPPIQTAGASPATSPATPPPQAAGLTPPSAPSPPVPPHTAAGPSPTPSITLSTQPTSPAPAPVSSTAGPPASTPPVAQQTQVAGLTPPATPSVAPPATSPTVSGPSGGSTERTLPTMPPPAASGAAGFKTGVKAALIIGNGTYKNRPLANPPNDAEDMSKKLKQLGFRVETLINATQQQMEEAVVVFGRSLRTGDAGVFYYAGHGMQVGGVNYIIPVGVEIRSESEVKYKAVNANWVLEQMNEARNSLNVLVLDACRDNPLGRGASRPGGTSGLAPITIDPTGTGAFIAFATAPGQTAEDGIGRNGTFTKHLLANLDVPGLNLEQVFKQTRAGVKQETSGRQVPWDTSSVVGEFYFHPGPPVVATPSGAPVPGPPAVPAAGQ